MVFVYGCVDPFQFEAKKADGGDTASRWDKQTIIVRYEKLALISRLGIIVIT